MSAQPVITTITRTRAERPAPEACRAPCLWERRFFALLDVHKKLRKEMLKSAMERATAGPDEESEEDAAEAALDFEGAAPAPDAPDDAPLTDDEERAADAVRRGRFHHE